MPERLEVKKVWTVRMMYRQNGSQNPEEEYLCTVTADDFDQACRRGLQWVEQLSNGQHQARLIAVEPHGIGGVIV